MSGENDTRFVELETRIAYQEESIRVLSDAVADQQRQIDQLKRFSRELLERIKSQADSNSGPGDPAQEVPPHY